MPPPQKVERGSTRDAGVPETRPPEPGVGPTPEATVPETRSAEEGVSVSVVAAVAVAVTVAWVGAVLVLAWWLIRTVLL
jgi:hypothetical protein